MFKRVMVAVAGIPALILLLSVAPEELTMLLTAAMCGIGTYELMRAVAGERGRALTPLAVLMSALVSMDIYLTPLLSYLPIGVLNGTDLYTGVLIQGTAGGSLPSVLPILALAYVLALFLCAIRRYGGEDALSFSAITAALFAGLVFPVMLSCLLRLRLLEYGQLLVWMPLCVSFGSDTFALFAGMLCGRHKLTPVSPKKTVEGAFGGLLGGVIGMALFKLIAGAVLGQGALGWPALLDWPLAVLLGITGSAVGQLGDLSFSVIKREFGVKDYGNLLPGHGGILDRFDSVTFVAPFVWFVIGLL